MERVKKGGILFATLISLAGSIVGLVFASSSSGSSIPTRTAVGIISGVALLTIVYVTFPLITKFGKKIAEFRERVTKYPGLLKAHETALSETEDLKRIISAFPEELKKAKLEEREEMLGDTLARAHPTTIALIAIGKTEGRLFFVAKVSADELPPIRSRYVLQSKVLGAKRGALRVFEHEAPDRIRLEVTSQFEGTSEFWLQLFEKTSVSETPPTDIELTLDETRTKFFEGELAE